MGKKTAHIISHSHWDREWYMSLEEHKYYLVKLFDDLLAKLKEDPDFHSFHLDGQTIMVDDYLGVRPEREAEVKAYIRGGRLIVGPWYILQDAFLTSSEANVRNLLYGMKDTAEWGQDGYLGYYPDTFGVYGQAPQLLKQANIDTAAFGRGVTPTGFNNQVHHDEFSSPYSEMVWEAPDGSQVLGILFANWYSNGNEVPSDREGAKAYWEKKLAESERFASTSQLLYMNGCDHQPLQADITTAIEVANELMPDVTFKHSSFKAYIDDVKNELPDDLQTIRGELRNQKTDGWSTLVNTASARIYLKQANDRCQLLLENVLEPLGVLVGDRDLHRDFSEYYWKLLMENHPHDSICGCSVDEVHREMVTRFEKVEKGALRFIHEQLRDMASDLDTGHSDPLAVPLILFHTEASSRVITQKVMVDKIYFSDRDFREIPGLLKGRELPVYALERADGTLIPVHVEDHGVSFGYDLPRDGFRRPYYGREISITFPIDFTTALGYEVVHLIPSDERIVGKGMWNEEKRQLENGNLLVTIHENGSYSLVDKRTGYEYPNLGVYEDSGDIGNEYMFKETGDRLRFTTEDALSAIGVVTDTPYKSIVEIRITMIIPKSAHEHLQQERENLVWHPERTATRSEELTEFPITTTLTFLKGAEGLKVDVKMDNQVRDHRIRARFPVGKGNDHHYADSIFEIVKRPNQPERQWANPTFDHHMQRFASLDDGVQGLTVAGIGLHEYEITGGNVVELTLLRSVGELGDWGVFDTPEAQCIGEQSASFMIIPHAGSVLESKVYNRAYSYPIDPTVVQVERNDGNGSRGEAPFKWTGESLTLTAIKPSLKGTGIIVRWFNPTAEEQLLTVEGSVLYRSTILEEKKEQIGTGKAACAVRPYEIITMIIDEE